MGLTHGVVSGVLADLHAKGDLYRLDETQLARTFVGAFFDGNPFRVPFSELRDTISALWSHPDDIPTEERAFADWLLKEVLCMSDLPREALLDLDTEASSDLVALEKNIDLCKREIRQIENRVPTDHDGPDRRLYEHYQEINIAAREEIVSALRGPIRYEALRRSRRKLSPFAQPIDFHVAWSFRWFPERFNPESFSELSNKFGGIGIQDLEMAERLYKTDLTAFDSFLDKYFEIHHPVRDIRDAIDKHHRLMPRRGVLEAAMRAFEQCEFELFTATAGLQVEGIFEDCCLDLGSKRESLLTQTLVSKVEALRRAGATLSDYAYYAFRFPALRNHIAHGRILAGDRVRTARLLLLDLLAVCDILRSLPSTVNRLVALLRSVLPSGPTDKELLKFASLLDPSGKAPSLDPCYGMEELIGRMQVGVASEPFWDYLQHLAGSQVGSADLAAGLKNVAIALKSSSNSRSVHLLALLGNSKAADRFDHEEFWQQIDAVPSFSAPMTA